MGPVVRSLADSLRALSVGDMTLLLRLRPDLAQPRPTDLTELIERAASATSTQAAMAGLNAWQLRVAEALAAQPEPVSMRRLATLLEADSAEVSEAVDGLRQRALVWGTGRELNLTQAARARFGAHPAGLAPASPVPLSDAEIDAALDQLGERGLAVLDRLLWGPPTGSAPHADRSITLADAKSPVEQALATKLVRPLDADTIVLPREVALRVRGGRLFADQISPRPPPWPPARDSAAIVDAGGMGTAVAWTSAVTALIDELGHRAPQVLTSGGIARRDLARLAPIMGSDVDAVFALYLVRQANLIAVRSHQWMPTTTFDTWANESLWQRWVGLRTAWLGLPWWPDEATTVLSPEITQPRVAELRSLAFNQLRSANAGATIEAGVLADRLAWSRPAWVRHDLHQVANVVMTEAARLGLIALGAATALVTAEHDPGMPTPVENFILQSDLTAVAAGPLARPVAEVLDTLTERESGNVQRFTATSIRRGLDSGWTASDLSSWLADHSATPVPQPLDYLISDVARAHGNIRVAAVSTVVRLDDEATAETLLRHPDAARLGLRRVGPLVLASQSDAAEVAETLRELGHAPIGEDASGAALRPTSPPRARPPAPVPAPFPTPDDASLEDLAEQLISGGEQRHAKASLNLVTVLQQAQVSGQWIRLDHVDTHGVARTATVRVMAVANGQARVMRKAAGAMVVPLSRVVSARPLN